MLCYVMLFCFILSKNNIMNEWSAEGLNETKTFICRFSRANIYMMLRKVQMRWGRLILYERRLLFMIERTDQSLCQRSKLLILNWIRNELKELNCERLHPRCSRLTCIEETKIKENDKILQQCVVWRSIVVTLFCFLWMKCREGEQLWRLIIEFTCYKVKSSIIAIL